MPARPFLRDAGHLSYTTLRKQALVTDMALRHRDIRALEPQVALPCEHAGRATVLTARVCLREEGFRVHVWQARPAPCLCSAAHGGFGGEGRGREGDPRGFPQNNAPGPAFSDGLAAALLIADPPAILVRKQAIVLNLEGLKLIIGRCGGMVGCSGPDLRRSGAAASSLPPSPPLCGAMKRAGSVQALSPGCLRATAIPTRRPLFPPNQPPLLPPHPGCLRTGKRCWC